MTLLRGNNRTGCRSIGIAQKPLSTPCATPPRWQFASRVAPRHTNTTCLAPNKSQPKATRPLRACPCRCPEVALRSVVHKSNDVFRNERRLAVGRFNCIYLQFDPKKEVEKKDEKCGKRPFNGNTGVGSCHLATVTFGVVGIFDILHCTPFLAGGMGEGYDHRAPECCAPSWLRININPTWNRFKGSTDSAKWMRIRQFGGWGHSLGTPNTVHFLMHVSPIAEKKH